MAALRSPPLKSSHSSPPGPGSDRHAGSTHGQGEATTAFGQDEDHLGLATGEMSAQDLSAPSLKSPGIKVEFAGNETAAPSHAKDAAPGGESRPPLAAHPRSAPAVQQFQSPMRQHRRTPSQHREVKETLNARSEHGNEDADGRSQHTVNQYRIMDEIGRGSYGAVHRAVDQFGNEYAVKEFSKTRLRKRAQSNILRRGPRRPGGRYPMRASMGPGQGPGIDPTVSNELSDQKASEARDSLFLIRQEIAIMKKLNHPNLVSLIEVLDDPEEDSLYLVLEMCKKGVVMKVGLDEKAVPYGEEQCRYWFRDLILGIEYLHAQGVLHRDIKPDNLLLTEDDVLKIVDFGVSEMFEKPEQMRTAKSAGSPAFLPPELCVARHGDVSGTAADIWSMGVSLYCLRYGHIPFNEPGVLEMYEAIKTQEPQMPEDENPNFRDLIMRLMEKDPGKRINMLEMREHPWVTKDGTDPLLSTEENCSDPVEPPNELEVNHAFTRRMSHLLCVMKAISNFKSLLPSRSRLNSPRFSLLPQDALDPTWSRPHHKPKPSMDEQELAALKSANEGHAARLLEERQRVLQNGGTPMPVQDNTSAVGSVPVAVPVQSSAPPVLGIGTGEYHDGEEMAIVADSPTAVEFDVYDRAYSEEVERIKQSGGKPSVYMTRHLRDKEKFTAETEVEGGEGEGEQEVDKVKTMFNRPGRFADLVTQAMKNKGEDRKE